MWFNWLRPTARQDVSCALHETKQLTLKVNVVQEQPWLTKLKWSFLSRSRLRVIYLPWNSGSRLALESIAVSSAARLSSRNMLRQTAASTSKRIWRTYKNKGPNIVGQYGDFNTSWKTWWIKSFPRRAMRLAHLVYRQRRKASPVCEDNRLFQSITIFWQFALQTDTTLTPRIDSTSQ